jgi:hypothetical protein
MKLGYTIMRCGGSGPLQREVKESPGWTSISTAVRSAPTGGSLLELCGHARRVSSCPRRTDDTDARKEARRCFGRSDRRTQRYWPCESLPRKDCLERGRGDFADKEGIAGSALKYSAIFGMRVNVLMQQVEVPRRGPARSRFWVHLWPFFPWFLTAGAAHE